MIGFAVENVKMPAIDRAAVRKWLKAVAEDHDGRETGDLYYVFCDDSRIIEVNNEFLGHDYFTDIITFDYSSPKRISGDMYISLDTVLSNSSKFHTSYEKELLRVIVHGVLHLCGINDKGPGERAVMEKHEERALDMWYKKQF